jgi:hypothetical protein
MWDQQRAGDSRHISQEITRSVEACILAKLVVDENVNLSRKSWSRNEIGYVIGSSARQIGRECGVAGV